MFKKSALLLSLIFLTVFGASFLQEWRTVQHLPSRYDSGLTIEKAFQTSKQPLLIEFYSDQCQTCQRVTPTVHEAYQRLKSNVTLVMVDTDDPANGPILQLFGVKNIPDLYVFDFKRMKKHGIDLQTLKSPQTFIAAVHKALGIGKG